jgi:hypothetical protein
VIIWDYGHTDDLLRLLRDMADSLERLEREEAQAGTQNEPCEAVIFTRDARRQTEVAEALARVAS